MIRLRPAIRLATLVAAIALVACESPESAQNESDRTETESSLDVSPTELVDRAEQLRDRSFDNPPDFSAREGTVDIEGSSFVDEAGQRERSRLAEILIGSESVNESRSRTALETVADYDAEDHEVVFNRLVDSRARLRAAILAALVDALEHRHFDPWPTASTWDRQLALRAADRAPSVLVAAADAFSRHLQVAPSTGLDRLTRRPDLATSIAPFDELFFEGRESSEGREKARLAADESQFAMREGFALAAALFRSSGWSGIELLRTRPPESSADVARPDRWMAGRGFGSWNWSSVKLPEDHPASGWSPSRSGTVGPAATTLWLQQRIPTAAARTAFSSWQSDSYRIRTPESANGDWRFEWATQWETPSDARELTRGFKKVLDVTHGDDSNVRVDVARRGLRVLVVIETGEHAGPDEGPASTLEDVRPTFDSRDALPLDYVPTRLDTFNRKVSDASREEGTWTSPEAGIRVPLDPVSDWSFRRSRTPPLRWFARGPSGGLVQLSTELQSPLAPSFGSSDYLQKTLEDYRNGFQKVEGSSSEKTDGPGNQTLVFRVDGARGGKNTHLRAWQFRRGDVIVTLSIQTPSEGRKAAVDRGRSLLEGIELTGPPPGTDDDASEDEGTGSIEYEIEEE